MFQAWVRYGHSCYRVASHEQTYEDAMMEYYCQGPLLTVENRCLYLGGKKTVLIDVVRQLPPHLCVRSSWQV